MNYFDLDLEVSASVGRDYSVRVPYFPAGKALKTMCFPFNEEV
jgi:hypothetical protein